MSTRPSRFRRHTNLLVTRFRKNYLPQSLFSRSMVILVTPLVLTLGIGLFVFFDRHWSTTTASLANSLAGEIALVAYMIENEDDPQKKQAFITEAGDKLALYIHYLDQMPALESKRLGLPGIHTTLERAMQRRVAPRDFVIRAHIKDGERWIVILVPVDNGALQVILPEKRLFSTTTYVFLLIMIGSGLLLSIVAVIFMRNQIRPVNRLAIVAEQFGKGIDTPRFRPTGAREVRQAAQAFLEMRERIKRQIRQRTDMLSGVSHDLRTPLTRLRLQLAMLPAGPDIDAMIDDIQTMDRMIKAYLDFARDETTERPLRCNIAGLLHQSIQDVIRQGYDVTTDITEQDMQVMTLRPQALRRVFANILENARLYAPRVWVTLGRTTRGIEIVFDDNGPGIPAEKREEAFKPFQRIDESRNQTIGGTGLGLTISRDIVQTHGGTITLDSSPYGGLRVTIWLPL